MNEQNNETMMEQNQNDNQQYIDAIRELQQNSVSKDKYAKLEKENKQLLDTLVNGGTIEAVNVEAPKSIEDLRKELYKSGPRTNLDYVKKSLELRERVMEETGVDNYFVPNVINHQRAQEIANIYQDCVDAANDDPEAFTRELQKRMFDSPIANIRNTNTNTKRR